MLERCRRRPEQKEGTDGIEKVKRQTDRQTNKKEEQNQVSLDTKKQLR